MIMSKGDWVFERSSGFPGFRCLTCQQWVYREHPKICICDKPAYMTPGTPEYYDSHIDCAAVKSTDGQVWTGKRHCHCMATIKQAGLKISHGEQGFVTMSGKYVSREEGAALVLKTGQVKLNTPPLLYSEDLY